jgi:hypothetical protein
MRLLCLEDDQVGSASEWCKAADVDHHTRWQCCESDACCTSSPQGTVRAVWPFFLRSRVPLVPTPSSMRVNNGIPLGCSLLLPVATVNSIQTLKAPVELLLEVGTGITNLFGWQMRTDLSICTLAESLQAGTIVTTRLRGLTQGPPPSLSPSLIRLR